MAERPIDPHEPRPDLDPEGRPIPPLQNNVTMSPERRGGNGGWFIAGIIIVLLIIGGIFYSNSGGENGNAPQTAGTQSTAPADNMTTGSTTNGNDAGTTAPAKPAAPATPPAAPSNNAAPATGNGSAQ